MSGDLKSTKCGKSCEFSKISLFCFDCPALMCPRCDQELHKKLKHSVMSFQNNNLKWNDNNLIVSLFDDKSLGSKVFKEVSRELKKVSKTEKPEKIFTPELRLEKDGSVGWACSSCTLINESNQMKCSGCFLFRIMEDFTGEYNTKLSKYMQKINSLFVSLEDHEEISFEHVVKEYLNSSTSNFKLWFYQHYANEKKLSIINDVVNKENHNLPMNILKTKYCDLIKERNNTILDLLPVSLKRKVNIKPDELLLPADFNEHFHISEDMKNKEVTDDEIWEVIIKSKNYTDRQRRMLMTELNLVANEKVSLLRSIMNDPELGPYLKDSCPDGNVKMVHVRQALVDQILVRDIINFLKKECLVCCEDYPMPMFQPMLICKHEYCKNCFKSWLMATITDKYPCKWACPNCPDEAHTNADKNLHYCNLKQFLADNNCDKAVIKIFDEKLLNERLQGSPSFHWCANEQCENGFEAEGVNMKVQCPSCKMHMCVQCNREWKKEHENATCQEYEMFMLKNDPNLARILNEIGIECPKCGMRYALAPGGCLHFDCRACGWVFCGGCYEEFTKTCNIPGCGMGNGLHGHHPRNCLYFLRDNMPKELENMLKDADYPRLINKPEKQCPFIVAEKKTLVNRPCGEIVFGTSGLCETHYKEYLVQFINRLNIDPANFGGVKELNLMLQQGLKKPMEKKRGETDEAFIIRLRNEVIKSCKFYIPKGLEVVAKDA